jgi:FtsZ-binding cell division protein ZapB
MTQKSPNNSSVSKLLQTIDPSGIADESVRRTVEILLNLIEELNLEVKELREENQRLRSENNGYRFNTKDFYVATEELNKLIKSTEQ